MDDNEWEFIRCPFCGYQGIETKPGKSFCPECGTAFEIEDRGECVFVDLNSPRLPIEGIICTRCGLVQREEAENCVCFGDSLYEKEHGEKISKYGLCSLMSLVSRFMDEPLKMHC